MSAEIPNNDNNGNNEGGDLREIVAAVEAVLFASPRPVSIKTLCSILHGYEPSRVRESVEVLRHRYSGPGYGIELHEVAGGIVFRTRKEYREHVLKARQKGPARLSRAAMETLALIAYKQPVTRAEIEAVRGVDSSGTIRFLLERRLVRIQGRKDVPGRPLLYGTTRFFLELFQLKDLKSLPDSSELKELDLLSKGQLSLFDNKGGENPGHGDAADSADSPGAGKEPDSKEEKTGEAEGIKP